jgi:hypothetical protein
VQSRFQEDVEGIVDTVGLVELAHVVVIQLESTIHHEVPVMEVIALDYQSQVPLLSVRIHSQPT